MKMFKKNDGFTLVELIVVIAILAILAGVGVAGYNGYIKKANDAAVLNDLSAIKTAATAANATAGEIESITVNGTNVTVVAKTSLSSTFKSDFETYYAGSNVTMPAASATGAEARTATITIKAISGWANSKFGATDMTAYWGGSNWEAKAATTNP